MLENNLMLYEPNVIKIPNILIIISLNINRTKVIKPNV